jgi:hypothetical protein
MQEKEDLALTGLRSFIHLRRAPPWRRDEAGVGRVRAKFLSKVERAVGATSVHDDDLGGGGVRETCKTLR